jgi:YD repeat-containing protein
MQTIYYPGDDILEIHFSDKPIVREVSQGWNVNISYDAEGNIVEMVILDARAIGLMPVQEKQAA